MNTDPLKFSTFDEDKARADRWWPNPLMQAGNYFKTKAQKNSLETALAAMDFGQAETHPGPDEPGHDPLNAHFPYKAGPTLWALRGLMGSLYKRDCAAQLNRLNEFFRQAPTPLPFPAAHLWPGSWKRSNGLRQLLSWAHHDPQGAGAELLTHVIQKLPDVVLWEMNHFSVLQGPRLPEDFFTRPSIRTGEPDEVVTTYTGWPLRRNDPSFLVSLLNLEQGREPTLLRMVLALDPLGHQPPQTRELSLLNVAVTHQSDLLLAYARPRLDAEQIVHTAPITRWGTTLPQKLLRDGLYEQFRQEVPDVNVVDAQGMSFFHHLLNGWSHQKKTGTHDYHGLAIYAPKSVAEMAEEFKGIFERWNFLISLGGQPHRPCQPPDSTTLKLIKSGDYKGKPSAWTAAGGMENKWFKRDAFPGETPLDNLHRRRQPLTKRTDETGFPEETFLMVHAALRQTEALQTTPERSRRRVRS